MNWLIRAYPYDPIAEAVVTVHVSLGGWVTEPDEGNAVPNTYWDRRVQVPLSETISLFDGDQIGGRSTASLGNVLIANDDGGIDGWFDWCWDGRRMELYRSDVAAPAFLEDWTLVAVRTVEEIVPGDSVELVLTDAQARFDLPARRGTFAGSGGVEGNDALRGRAKPFLLGRARRFEPVLIDAERSMYIVDPAGIAALLAADDGGAPFAIGPDVADYAALAALDMTALDLATSLDAGLLRLSEPPALRLRISADGVAPGGDWISDAAALAAHVAVAFAGMDPSEVDAASVDALAALQPAVLGYWYDGGAELTAAALMDALMDSIGGYWGIGLDGRLALGRYDLPAETVAARIGRRDMLALTPQQAARRIKSVRLSYRPGLALSDSELAAGISDADRELAARDREWTATASSGVTAAESLLAGTLDKDTLFDALADAEKERDRLLALLSARRQPFDVSVRLGAAFDGVRVGDTIELTDTRYGLSGGRSFVVLRRVADTGPDLPTLTFTVL